ncbi:MAG: hypothetical protein DVS81_17835 [Candidatus Accumulibacter meliphilus]|uniref:Uncharacterized protein n=1 Tax=Candidatus Accumulibacter meliphilus TaxID=2211374 RepID=A0A369XLW3_9PROT|nr:MAG: hypothetical protein DVS81_17835 [Candidatus Accumulibacter meliphilus]
MRSLVIAVCCFCFGSASANSGLEYPSMWICDEDRFNWYCDIPPAAEPTGSSAENPEAKALSEEEEAVAALKALREDAERKRALAIIKPTPENLTRAAATARATATAWARVATMRRTTACARSISGPKNSASAKRWRWK